MSGASGSDAGPTTGPLGGDEGGDPACWAHLVDDAGRTPLGSTAWPSLLHQLADAVLAADRDGTITYWNEAAERLFGWSAAEATGQTLDLIVPERFRARHDEGYRRVAESGTTKYGDRLLEVPALRKDGRPLSISFTITLLQDPDGRVERMVAVIRDDTERWNERRALRAEIEALRDADRATPESRRP